MRIDPAPVLKPIIDDILLSAQGWTQWFSSVGDALKGDWFNGERSLSGTSVPSGIAKYNVFGGGIIVFMNFTSGTFSSCEINLPFKVYDGQYLDLILDGINTKVIVSDSKISLSNGAFTSATIQGTLILKG